MSTPSSQELVALCEARLGEITADDSAALTQFAECRLVEVGVPSQYGEDIAQRAFQAVLRGLETDQGGRKPRLVDIQNKPAFMNYMRGIINSLVYAFIQKRGFTAAGPGVDVPADPGTHSPAQQAELKDLSAQLFPRLRARAPQRLLRTIDAWESVFLESDRIPAPGHRRYVREIRNLAQQVLSELEGRAES